MIVTIHQPDFIPWLGFFSRWKRSDLYIVLDDVQFIKRGWQHRDKIKTAQGPKWLTIPLVGTNQSTLIKDIKIDNSQNWRKKHLSTIHHAYSKAANYPGLIEEIVPLYQLDTDSLLEFNMAFLMFFAKKFDINTPIQYASQYRVESKSTERLVELMALAEGTEYLTGQGSRGYLDTLLFENKQIKILWDNYKAPQYPQLFDEFIPGLSVLDVMMNNSSDYKLYL